MSLPYVTVVAEMAAKPGQEEALKQALLNLVEHTRKEDGCVQYDLHVANEDAGRFVFVENWTSREALERHFQTPHLQAFQRMAADLREPPRVTLYTRIA